MAGESSSSRTVNNSRREVGSPAGVYRRPSGRQDRPVHIRFDSVWI